MNTMYGLPEEVIYCTRCVISNQRPASSIEFRHTVDRKVTTIEFDEEGVCDACRYAERKEEIDWDARRAELDALLDRYRRNDGSYDCVVPGSGGKDSCYAAWVLKHEFGMNPLTVTWPPILYTDIGRKNFDAWTHIGGFDNVTYTPNGRIHSLLTRLAISNLMHPFQSFILGQKNLAPKMALRFGIDLVFYGENEAEYGNPIADNAASLRDKSFYTSTHIDDLTLGGVAVPDLISEYGLSLNDLNAYLPADHRELERSDIGVHYLGYYLKWTPQEAFYHAVDHCGFEANSIRTEGTYSKYNSLDDKIDGLHYYTTFVKFGLGRTSYDAAQEIRNRHITRDEGIALIRKFDGEYPARYLEDVLAYIDLTEDEFIELVDRFRPPHLWTREGGQWHLRHQIS